jgi:hypothetical protein
MTGEATAVGLAARTERYFEYARFVPEAAKAQVADRLREYQSAVVEYFNDNGVTDVDLYISGSLARGEAAVCRMGDGFGLASDLDLMAVVGDEPPGSRTDHGDDCGLG